MTIPPERVVYREIAGASVRVNRRGCSGAWTPADDVALEELVRAVLALSPAQLQALRDKAPDR